MTAKQASQLISSMKTARKVMAEMSAAERKSLEKSWDVEHAYYSSTLEGSKIDRKEVERIAKKVE